MTSELKDALPAAEHTTITLHPNVAQSGVEIVSETQHAQNLHERAVAVGGSVTGEVTDASPTQKPPDLKKESREFGLWNFLRRKKRKEGLKNAA